MADKKTDVAIEAKSGQEVDRIRDIILGPQIRDYDQRFQNIQRLRTNRAGGAEQSNRFHGITRVQVFSNLQVPGNCPKFPTSRFAQSATETDSIPQDRWPTVLTARPRP